MLKIYLFYLYFNYLCTVLIVDDIKLLKIEQKNYNFKTQELRTKFAKELMNFTKNKYQKLNYEEKFKNTYFFKESYDFASKYIKLFFKKFKNIKKNEINYSVNSIEKFLNFLSENLDINSDNLTFLNQVLSYNYLNNYFILMKNLYQCNKNKQIFNDLLDVENIENNIDLCFYKLSKYFIKSPKKKSKNYYINMFFLLKFLFNKNLERNKNLYNISEMLQNNIILYLFSPYFLSYYIYYKFVETYFYDILIFFEKNKNKNKNNLNLNLNFKYKFKIKNTEKNIYFFTLKNKFKKIKINLKIDTLIKFKIDQTETCFSSLDLKVIYDDKKDFNYPALVTKDNLKLMFKKNNELLNYL